MSNKIGWDEYFVRMAELAAKRSSCYSPKGAVIVKDYAVISTGYNGASKGGEECTRLGFCKKRALGYGSGKGHDHCPAAHAELNAIVLAAKNGSNVQGATLYCTHFPCSMCMRYIANSGIVRVVYTWSYPDDDSLGMAQKANIKVEKYDI